MCRRCPRKRAKLRSPLRKLTRPKVSAFVRCVLVHLFGAFWCICWCVLVLFDASLLCADNDKEDDKKKIAELEAKIEEMVIAKKKHKSK